MGGPLRDLRELLPLWIAGRDTNDVRRMLESVRLSNVTVTDAGLRATIALQVAPRATVSPPPAEPTLSPEELQRWESTVQRWDAFLTFLVTVLGRDSPLPDFHAALGTTLIEGRYDIVETLAPSVPGAYDPTPALFLKTWERLAPILRHAAASQPGAVGLRYLSFITAADALAALQQLGPGIGVEISADGLRRLARIVAPTAPEDPLAYSTDVDPDLRDLLGFGVPLPPPTFPAMRRSRKHAGGSGGGNGRHSRRMRRHRRRSQGGCRAASASTTTCARCVASSTRPPPPPSAAGRSTQPT